MKRLRVILLFLLLGAIVNVAVAWGCVIFVNFSAHLPLGEDAVRGLTSETGAGWSVSRADYFGSTFLLGESIFERDRKDEYLMEYFSSWKILPAPAWSQCADPPTSQRSIIEEARGWPVRTLSTFEDFHSYTDTSYARKHAWIVREQRGYSIYLPLAPLWRGMLFNTIFYASLLWLLIPGPFALRRCIRRKRGLCVKCAYDLRGVDHQACPECGLEVPLQ